jgi:hypothetical protein
MWMQISKGKHQFFLLVMLRYTENGFALQLGLDNYGCIFIGINYFTVYCFSYNTILCTGDK